MPREAECIAEWNGVRAEVKAVLESCELHLRLGIRRRIPFAAIKNLAIENDRLLFEFDGDTCSLAVGNALATSWAKIIRKPEPTLAEKLGIHAEMTVEVAGVVEDGALHDALSKCAQLVTSGGALIVARVNSPAELAAVLKAKSKPLASGIPMWVVFPKGKAQPISEHDVRALCLATGIVDSKVAAVLSALTALRFVKRRNPAKE